MRKRAMFIGFSRRILPWKIGLLSFLVILLLFFIFLAPVFIPYDPYEQHLDLARAMPSAAHWLGTDRYGRDVLSRVWLGGQVTVLGALGVVILMTFTGTMIGVSAGWYKGWLDQILMRTSDLFLAFPGLVLALAMAGVSHGGIVSAILALWVVSWPKYARLSRSLTLSVQGQSYIDAARLMGVPTWKILISHVLPNIASPILITAILDIGTMMMALSGLSFLGLGVKPPTPEWGAMISEGRQFLQLCPWMVMAPGAAMFMTVVIFNVWGDALRDYYDPKEK